MSCRRFDKEIALWVEGDLPLRPARRLEAHLQTCAACRELASGLRASQAALKEALAEVSEADLAEVRQRVLARIREEAPRRRLWSWAWAPAGIAAALLAAWVLVPRPEPAPPPPPPIVKPATAPTPLPRPAQLRPRAPSEPLLVKLYTDDPEVVIYWFIEKKGD